MVAEGKRILSPSPITWWPGAWTSLETCWLFWSRGLANLILGSGTRDPNALLYTRWDYHLAMSLVAIFSSGLTPVIYLIGGRDYYTRAMSSGEKNFVQHIMSMIRGEKRN